MILLNVAYTISKIFVWPGVTLDSLKAKPFHIYDDEFFDIIGEDPTLTLIASSESDPLFHEAVVWYVLKVITIVYLLINYTIRNPTTDEVFFVQNAGAVAAGTGLNKSSIIQKISLSQADAVKSSLNATGQVTVDTVPSTPQIINPNGML